MRLGMVSTYPPRRCGSAAFAADLGRALAPEFEVVVCAVDRYGLTYPREVAAVIAEDDREDYRRAARVLAEHGVDLVLLHYDGGEGHPLDLVRELGQLGLPYVVAMHRRPSVDPRAQRTAAAVLAGAERVLVFNEADRDAAWGVDPGRVVLMPLAVPTVLWHSRRTSGRRGMRERAAIKPRPSVAAVLASLGDGPVVAGVGTLSPERDIESLIATMPAVRAGHPAAHLIIAGLTPAGGEAYRTQLAGLVADLDLADAVHLLDLHLSPIELSALFARTDVVVVPAFPAERAWSALMTAAVTAGCPVVARPHPYADELLASGAGTTAEPDRLGPAILGYLDAPDRLAGARAAALARGRRLTWPAVTNRYASLLRSVVRPAAADPGRAVDLRLTSVVVPAPGEAAAWARLSVVGTGLVALPTETLAPREWRRALSWLDSAMTELASGAANGAPGWAVWGLGRVAAEPAVPLPLRERARQLRDMAATLDRHGLDEAAYATLGLAADPTLDETGRALVVDAVAPLAHARSEASWRGPAWPWFTDRLDTGAGARLPEALILAGHRLGDDELLGHGLVSLDWYARRCGLAGPSGIVRLPTSRAETAVDAGALVEALAVAYRVTGASQLARFAVAAFAWFSGANRSATAVYDPELGSAAADGSLVRPGEGTLAYLAALLSLVGAGLVTLPTAPVLVLPGLATPHP